MVLFSTKLISETSSVHHRLLGLLLAVLAGGEHVVEVSLHLMDVILELPLVVGEAGVAGNDVRHLFSGVNQLLFNLSLNSDGSIQESLGFLQFSFHGVALAFS